MGYVLFFLMLAAAVLMLPFSSAAVNGAAEGVRVFGETVLPSMLPFTVCAVYISGSGVLSRLKGANHKLLAVPLWLLAALCGTPSAAVISNGLDLRGYFDKRTLSALCASMTLMGPMFILSAFSEGMLKNRALAPAFFISLYLPSFLLTLLLSLLSNSGASSPHSAENRTVSLSSSIFEAVMSMLRVGGTIVFFKVIFSVFDAAIHLDDFPVLLRGFLFGAVEMTNGLLILAQEPTRLSLSFCASLLSFGGFSVFIQSKMIFPSLSPAPYLLTKLILGVSSGLIFWFIWPLIPTAVETLGSLSESLTEVSGSLSAKAASVFLSAAAAGTALLCALLYSKLAVRK